MCYTKKTSPALSEDEILDFIKRYNKLIKIEAITLCGGEVFLVPYISHLINALTDQGIFVQIITNGTIDRREELKNPNAINLIVSLDGLPLYHDKNRGKGAFEKSISFLQKAKKTGFHTEIFSIVTKQNYTQINKFELLICDIVGCEIPITYHPRKPLAYLSLHPTSNIKRVVEGFDFLDKKEMKWLMKHRKTFPPIELGCFQIALLSNGNVYGCCEGTTPIGTIHDGPRTLIDQLTKKLDQWKKISHNIRCLGCSEPDFMCGMKEYFS
jgi:MoaA/NifB/PqqE/SkfB family radical SAM enzyme